MDKQEIRRKMTDLLKESTGPAPAVVADRLCGLSEYKKSSIILAYVPLKSEIDISSFIDRALSDGKTVAFPDEKPGVFRVADKAWREKLTVLENRTKTLKDSPILDMDKGKALVLVPGLSFTKEGQRLGRGAGYYDRALDLLKTAGFEELTTIGICRIVQIVDELPCQAHDRKVDAVISF